MPSDSPGEIDTDRLAIYHYRIQVSSTGTVHVPNGTDWQSED